MSDIEDIFYDEDDYKARLVALSEASEKWISWVKNFQESQDLYKVADKYIPEDAIAMFQNDNLVLYFDYYDVEGD